MKKVKRIVAFMLLCLFCNAPVALAAEEVVQQVETKVGISLVVEDEIPDTGFFPNTGEQKTIVISLAGAIIVCVTVMLFILIRRKRKDEEGSDKR